MFFKWMKFGAIFLVVFLIPLMRPQALSTVHTQEELKQALSDTSVSTITLGNDIETTEKINIMRPVTIDGNHHTLRYVGTFGSSGSKDNTVWGGIYLLQVYKKVPREKVEKVIKNERPLVKRFISQTYDGEYGEMPLKVAGIIAQYIEESI